MHRGVFVWANDSVLTVQHCGALVVSSASVAVRWEAHVEEGEVRLQALFSLSLLLSFHIDAKLERKISTGPQCLFYRMFETDCHG